MLNSIKMELKKAIKNKYFYISLGIMMFVAILSSIYMVDNFTRMNLDKYFVDGKMIENELFPVLNSANSWIGAESMSVASSLFFLLLPFFAVLPFSWSYHIEKKSGYIRQVVSRKSKSSYFISKSIAVFASGALVVLIPLIANFLIITAVYPSTLPQINYAIYNHVSFGEMWSDLYYTQPFLYMTSYIMLNACFAGLFALLAFSVSFVFENRIAIVFFPFIVCVGIDYFTEFLRSKTLGLNPWMTELSPIAFLRASNVRLTTTGFAVILFALAILALSLPVILLRGKNRDVF